MIEGVVNDSLEATLSLAVQGHGDCSHLIEVIIDTCFSGSLTLPASVIEALKLTWLCRQQGMLADGKVHPFDVYIAVVVWNGKEQTIEVEAADLDPLLGMSLLNGHRLSIDVFDGGQVVVEMLD